MESEKSTPNDALSTEHPMIAKAKQQLNSMVLNDLEREYYEAQLKANLDHNSELEEMESRWEEIETEREELEKEKAQFETEKFEIVRRLFNMGANDKFVANIMAYSEEKVEKLRKEM